MNASAALAREQLASQGWTRAELDTMPPDVVAELAASAIVHVCACCGRDYTRRTWRQCEQLGLRDDRRYLGCWTIWANCPCGGTMTRAAFGDEVPS